MTMYDRIRPLVGSEAACKQHEAYTRGIILLSQKLINDYPLSDMTLMKYVYRIDLAPLVEIHVFDSNETGLPFGVTITSYDQSGGVSREQLVGLFSDWSYVYAVVKYLFELEALTP